MSDVPVITLENGLRVAHFSSPHPFNFVGGSLLPACSPERAKALMLETTEDESVRETWTDIEISFKLNESVISAIDELEDRDDIDIILVPLPVLQCLKGVGKVGKARCIRVADRVSKAVYTDRFCI